MPTTFVVGFPILVTNITTVVEITWSSYWHLTVGAKLSELAKTLNKILSDSHVSVKKFAKVTINTQAISPELLKRTK